MNRIALCLSGYYNSLTDKTSLGKDGFSYIKKNIFDKINSESQIDVFFHNWEPDMEDELVKMYEPKKYINPYPCQCIKFDETLDMTHFYQVYWDLFNEGPADMWFYSNSENMDNFCNIYDKTLNEYLKLNSDYHKATMNGWPQSKLNDFRSNELFKENPTNNLHKYRPHEFVNAILLYKWFLMDCELWYNSVALMTEWE